VSTLAKAEYYAQFPHHRFVAFTLNHRRIPFQVLERATLTAGQQSDVLLALRAAGLTDALVVSTCNRTEVYCRAPEPNCVAEVVWPFLGVEPAEARGIRHLLADTEAVEHLFRMALGLESKVVGDQQIIHQVKEAYELSVQLQTAGPYLHRLMQHVLRANKRARTETAIGRGMASVGGAAVQALQKRLGTALPQTPILVLGAGEIARATCNYLHSLQAQRVIILNRTPERARALAGKTHAQADDLARLLHYLPQVQAVVAATGATEPIIRRDDLLALPHYPRLWIDLALPRNIAPDIATLPQVELLSMESITSEKDENRRAREAAIPTILTMIADEQAALQAWVAAQLRHYQQPTVVS
jgi:glutamyl-tRNA reductase